MRLGSTAWRKLRRDLLAARWQFAAATLVIVLGVALFDGAYMSYQNLRASYDRSYQRLRMADLWFPLRDAPATVVDQVREVPGVQAASGRIVAEVPMYLPAQEGRRILARVVSMPAGQRPAVNDVKISEGRYFTAVAGREVLVERSFARHHHLRPGSTVYLVGADGQPAAFTVTGIVLSPEYLWVARSEQDLFPLPDNFGVLFLPQGQAEGLLGQPGRINEVAVVVAPGASAAQVQQGVASVLEPYGLGRVVSQGEQLSNRLLKMDLDAFSELAVVFPILFLTVAALALYTLLNRLVQSQRSHIGLMRAIGYSQTQIMVHYLGYALVVGLAGAVVGTGLGYLLSVLITRLYVGILSVPFVAVRPWWGAMSLGFAVGLVAALVAGLAPAWASARVPPAEAMRPSPPAAGRYLPLERRLPFLRPLPYTWKLPLRNLIRNRRRTLYTATGVASAIALALVASSFLDSYEFAIDLQFDKVQAYDARVNFVEPVGQDVAYEVVGWEGVERSEPMLEMPVFLQAGGHGLATLLVGLTPDSQLYRTYDEDGRRLYAQPGGLLLTLASRDLLDLKEGDTVRVQPLFGLGQPVVVTVAGFVEQPLGDMAFLPLEQVQALAGLKGAASALLLSFDSAAGPELISRLYQLPATGFVEFSTELRQFINETLQLFLAFIGIMLAFAVALGFAIVFNTVTVNVLERRREMATMRAFGTGMGRIVLMLTVENTLMGLLGVAVGIPVGYWLAQYFATLYNNDLFWMPVTIFPRTYGLAAAVMLLVLLLAEIPSVRYVSRLDLAAATKEWAT